MAGEPAAQRQRQVRSGGAARGDDVMKPMGAVPADFAGAAPLQIAGRPATAWSEQAGETPLFVYDAGVVRRRVARFRQAMPEGVDLHYAVKATPFAPLVAAIAPWVDGFDIASKGELERGVAIACKPAGAISFAGPGKRDDELEAAIRTGVTINLESEGEADRALAIGGRHGVTPRLAVRVNQDIELRGSGLRMGGRPSQFGIDAEKAAALVGRLLAAGADWRGFHIFAGSQALDAQASGETQAATLALAALLAEEAVAAPPLVNLGGGFGIPYFPADSALDVE